MKQISIEALPNLPPGHNLQGLLSVVRQLAEELETLGGLRENAAGQAAVTKQDLIDAGIASEDNRGVLYKRSES